MLEYEVPDTKCLFLNFQRRQIKTFPGIACVMKLSKFENCIISDNAPELLDVRITSLFLCLIKVITALRGFFC